MRNKISPGTRFSCRARSILDTAIGVIVALLVNYFLPRERVVRLWEGFKSVSAFADKKHPKNTVRYPELFQGQNGSKRFRVFDFSQFPRAGCYRFFSIPLFCPRPALFNPDSSCYNIH